MSYECTDTQAVCRGCGRHLRGNPYWKGGRAYYPLGEKGEVKACHYGGWVCSEGCDVRACRQLEESMPGHGPGSGIDRNLRKRIEEKWSNP